MKSGSGSRLNLTRQVPFKSAGDLLWLTQRMCARQVLFKQVRYLPRAKQVRPVMVHINYHPGAHPCDVFLLHKVLSLGRKPRTEVAACMPACRSADSAQASILHVLLFRNEKNLLKGM